MQITIHGPIPSKKNLLRRSRNGGMFRDRAISDQIAALTWQIKAQYQGDPLDRPSIKAMFFVTAERADIDNKWTTVLDCLVNAGVLINDNIKHGPRPQVLDWCKSETEGVVLEIEAA